MTIHPALGAFETAQEQDRVFDLVQRHLVPALEAHRLRIPSVHTHLLNACLNRLGVPTQLAASVWITKEHESGGFSYDCLVIGVEFPGGHVINYRGERGWAVPRAKRLEARYKPGEQPVGPQCRWMQLQHSDAAALIRKETDVVRSSRIDEVVGSVVSAIEQTSLLESTAPNALHCPPKQGTPRL